MPQITITYGLTERGRKAALLAGGQATETVTVRGEATLTPEDVERLVIRPDGTTYARQCTKSVGWGEHGAHVYAEVAPSTRGYILALDTYHATPAELLPALGEEWQRRQAEIAQQVAEAAERKRQQEEQEAERRAKRLAAAAPVLAAWRADETSMDVRESYSRGEIVVDSAGGERVTIRPTDGLSDYPGILAEARRRAALTEARVARERQEEEDRKAAAALAKLEHLRDWIRDSGTDDMRERQAAGAARAAGKPESEEGYRLLCLGLVPQAEVMDAIKAQIFAAFGPDLEFRKLRCSELDHASECDGRECSYDSEEALDVPPDVWAAMKRLRAIAPTGAELEARLHTATCDECEATATRYGVLVRLQSGPLTFHREFSI